MAEQIGAHALGIGVRLIDLVDGHDEGHLGGLRVSDGLHRLRHDAVIGRHHENDDVSHFGAAGAHGGERLMAWRIDEGDLLSCRRFDLIGANMLGDATRLRGDDVGRANGVEQRRLAVVDVTHDGDDGRTRLEVLGLVFCADKALFDVGLRHAARDMAELLGDELGRVSIDHVGDLMHLAVLHQVFDDVDAPHGHAVGELLDRDRVGDHDLALNFLLWLASDLLLLALAVALERGKAPLALLLVERVGNSEPPAHALLAALRGGRTFFLVAQLLRARPSRLFLHDEMLARGLLALFPRLSFGRETFLFFTLALLGLLALLFPFLVGDHLALRVFRDSLPLLGLALARVGQGAGAGVLLVVGEGAKHHARTAGLCGLGLSFLGWWLWRGLRRLRPSLLNGPRRGARANGPPLLFFHQYGLASPMAKALPHMAGLDGSAHVEGQLARFWDCLVFGLVSVAHSVSVLDPFRFTTPLR